MHLKGIYTVRAMYYNNFKQLKCIIIGIILFALIPC